MNEFNIIPNIFIVGAPRCGTTSLHRTLRKHPNVFLPTQKEPHYFANDFWGFRDNYIKDYKDYMALFSGCNAEHFVIGEASVWYMYSDVALENIQKYNQNAKIIIMVRNPIDMLRSLHNRLVYSQDEPEPDFQKAWNLQDVRKSGSQMPNHMITTDRTGDLLQYRQIGKIGFQIERLLDIFPFQNVKIIVFDDFISQPRKSYFDIFNFLSVPHVNNIDYFLKANPNRNNRMNWIRNIVHPLPKPIKNLANFTKKTMGIRSFGFIKLIDKLNSKKISRGPINQTFRLVLVDQFKDDIEKLEKILNRDLSHWFNVT
jgi:hypothetical protein